MNLSDSSTFGINTAAPTNQQASQVYPVNVPFLRAVLPQYGNGFTIEIDGTIQQGGTAQAITIGLFLGIGVSAGQTTGIAITIPAGSFTINTTVAFRVVIDWISQGNTNPLAGTPGHNSITVYINGIAVASASGGNVMNFHQQVDTVGVPYSQQFVWAVGTIGAAGPTITSFLSKFITYGFGS